MLKKTIKYKDFEGGEVVEDFYFNITMAEISKLALTSPEDDFVVYLQTMIKTRDGQQIIDTFEKIIRSAVGQRIEEDGKVKFKKSEKITSDLFDTNAYSALFMELIYEENAGRAVAEFIKGIVPEELRDGIDKAIAADEELSLPEEEPIWVKEGREPTKTEIKAMTPEQMQKEFLRKANASAE